MDTLLTLAHRDRTTGEWRVVVYPDERAGGKVIGTVERDRSYWIAQGFGHTFRSMQEAIEWVVRDWAHP